MKAKEILRLVDDAEVIKKTGSTKYILRRNVRIFLPDGKEIIEKEGLAFLCCPRTGNVNAVNEEKEFLWETTAKDLIFYEERIDGK